RILLSIWRSVPFRFQLLPVGDNRVAVGIDSGCGEARVQTVVPLDPGNLDIIAESEVQAEITADLPIILHIKGIIWPRAIEGVAVFHATAITAAAREPQQQARHRVAIDRSLAAIRELARRIAVELEIAVRQAGI